MIRYQVRHCLATRNVALFLLGTVILALVAIGCKTAFLPKPKPRFHGAGVHGSVVAGARLEQKGERSDLGKLGVGAGDIFMPDFEVSLRKGGAVTATVRTDVMGRYAFTVQKPGTYELVWKPQNGWAGGTYPEKIVIKNNTKFAHPVRIHPQHGSVIVGRVRLADGSIPRRLDDMAGVETTALLTLGDAASGTLVWKGKANAFGEYAIAGVPSTDHQLKVQWEADSATRLLSGAFIASAATPADIVLKNHPPQIVTLVATKAGKGVRSAASADTLTVTAEAQDPDGDPMNFDWKPAGDAGSVTGTGNSVQWTLPSGRGPRRLYLTVADSRGGYASRFVDVTLDQAAEWFSGRVIETTGAPVAGATVEVNKKTTTTAANGHFSIQVPIEPRYLMNIRKPGFALFSKMFDKANNGSTWTLVRGQSVTIDAGRDVVVIDEKSDGRYKEQRGARVSLTAGSLIDSSGAAATGPLTAVIATYNIEAGQLPGSDGAMEGGVEKIMLSYGGLFFELRDATGKMYNLAPGKTAEIEIPAPAKMTAAAPAKMELWDYDEKDGYWKPDGTAVFDPASKTYKGKVSHFSARNTDIASTDAACLKIILDATIPPGRCSLRGRYISGAQPFGQTKVLPLDDVENAFYRLPANSVIELELFDNQSGGIISNLEVVDGGSVAPNDRINTGAALPSGANLWPDPPYSSCKAITIRLAIPAGGPFLQLGTIGSTSPSTIGEAADADFYYGVIAPATADPNTVRQTLGQWWAVNGFSAVDGTAADEVRQAYVNYNDLGFGRDMHMRVQKDAGGNVIRAAAFVTNYGDHDQNPENANYANARDPDHRLATVCMEYAPVEGAGATKIVKFFVFGAGSGAFGADGGRLKSADLDGAGEKFVPKLCLNCHGGDFARLNDTSLSSFQRVNLGSVFREFDAPTFLYPGSVSTLPSGDPIHARLKGLNSITRDTCETFSASAAPESVRGGAIRNLIDGWYTGGATEQDNTWIPDAWKTTASATPPVPSQAAGLYRDFVAKSCRTCHVAFSVDGDHFGVSWASYDEMRNRSSSITGFAVCGGNKFMPHSKITFGNLWLSTGPHGPTLLQTYVDAPDWRPPPANSCQ